MAIEIPDRLRELVFGAKKIIGADSSYNARRLAEIEAEREKRMQDKLEQRRRLLEEEKNRQSYLPRGHWEKKEPFDVYRVMRGMNPYDSEEQIQRFLQNKDNIESLEMEYYLDYPDIKNNAQFINYIADEDH